MKVIATFQVCEYGFIDGSKKNHGEPFQKEFDDKSKMYEWLRKQDEHPWLTMELKGYEECSV